MYDDISGNAADFQRALNAIGTQVQDDIFNKIILKAIFNLASEIVTNTPRDTGRAMGSWMVDTQHGNFELPEGDYSGVDFSAKMEATCKALPESERYVIYNNLEYIQALENGHSKRAPSGFVAQALAAIGNHVAKAARAAGYEGTI